MENEHIAQVRRFNRTVTRHVGALEDSYLKRGRPLGEARLIHEIGADGIDIRRLRERLKLDSGYVSRLLRSLEGQGLVETGHNAADRRRRRVVLTPEGRAEHATYDMLSDELAESFLKPLSTRQRGRLVAAMSEVERLLRAGSVEVHFRAADSPDAQVCLSRYFEELSRRFDVGFDPSRSNSATAAEMTPPAGHFVLAELDGEPVGCGALKVAGRSIGEIKRMWTAPDARGLGISRRILHVLEAKALEIGLRALRLETNRVLVEAQALYRSEGYREVAAFNSEPYAHHWFEKQL